MMDCTDRHYHMLMRQMTQHTLLYTEMITANALIHGDRDKLIGFSPKQHPVALQVGGSHPDDLALCAQLAQQYGYREINLNVGCPSDRVQSGQFGACLMKRPALVAECIAAMSQAVSIPVTVKTRIGVDEQDSYEELVNFIELVSQAGCEIFILHARKAWLKGLSPRENREVPPLRYEVVYRLKQDFPHLTIVINGGIKTLNEATEHLRFVDGVMIGREAYSNPYLFAEVDQRFFGSIAAVLSRNEVLIKFLPYLKQQLAGGVKLGGISRHLIGLFQGEAGARRWRRYLSENAYKPGAGIEVIEAAMAELAAHSLA